MSSIRFLTAVMCDEVRREESGRAILIGATMAGPSLPSDKELLIARLGFYLEVEVCDVSEAEIRLVQRVTDENAFVVKVKFDLENMAKADPEEVKNIAVGTVIYLAMDDVTISAPGWYDLQYRVEGADDWKQIRDYLFPSETEAL